MISALQSPSLARLSPSLVSAGHPNFYHSMIQSVTASSVTSWTCMPDILPVEPIQIQTPVNIFSTIELITHILLSSFLCLIIKPFVFCTSNQLSR